MCRLNTLVCGAERKQLWQKRFCRKLCSSRSSKQTTASLKKPATSQNRCTTVASSKSCLYIFLRMFLPATCYCNPCLLSQTLPAIANFACYPEICLLSQTVSNFACYPKLCLLSQTVSNVACYPKLCLLSQTLPAMPNFACYPKLCLLSQTLCLKLGALTTPSDAWQQRTTT